MLHASGNIKEYRRFADTYNCIKTAFHDTDILADILARIVLEDVGVLRDFLFNLPQE